MVRYLVVVSFLVLAIVACTTTQAAAESGFYDGKDVYTARRCQAYYNACAGCSATTDWRGPLFTLSKGEAVKISSGSYGWEMAECDAIRVTNSSGNSGWVYAADLTATKPASFTENVETAIYSSANAALDWANSSKHFCRDGDTWGLCLR